MTRSSRPAPLTPVIVALALALIAGEGRANEADLDPILRILVKKGVLTLDEATTVQAEADAERRAEQAATAAAPTPAPAPAPPAAPASGTPASSEISTKFEMGKGVTFSKGDANLTITGRVQVRYDAAEEDADLLGNVLGSAREGAEETFDVRRARVSFQGAFNEQLDYRLQADFSGSATQVRYAEIMWHLKNGAFGIDAGQFKVPFGREQLTSSGDLQLVDRSIVDAFFHPAFDRGAMIYGRTPGKGRFHYAAGAFNSEGDTSRNVDGDFRTAVRVGFDPFGTYRPVQGGFERPEDLRLAFALQALHDDLKGATGDRDSFGADFALGLRWLTLDGEWVTVSTDIQGAGDFEADGLRVQAGFMLHGDLIELVARYASIDADFPGGSSFTGTGPDIFAGRGFRALGETMDDGFGGVAGAIYDELAAWTLGLNVYFRGHASKLQADYTWMDEDGFGGGAVPLDNDVFRIQYQVKF